MNIELQPSRTYSQELSQQEVLNSGIMCKRWCMDRDNRDNRSNHNYHSHHGSYRSSHSVPDLNGLHESNLRRAISDKCLVLKSNLQQNFATFGPKDNALLPTGGKDININDRKAVSNFGGNSGKMNVPNRDWPAEGD